MVLGVKIGFYGIVFYIIAVWSVSETVIVKEASFCAAAIGKELAISCNAGQAMLVDRLNRCITVFRVVYGYCRHIISPPKVFALYKPLARP